MLDNREARLDVLKGYTHGPRLGSVGQLSAGWSTLGAKTGTPPSPPWSLTFRSSWHPGAGRRDEQLLVSHPP